MKFLLIFSCFLFSFSSWGASASNPILALETGSEQTCILRAQKAHCFGGMAPGSGDAIKHFKNAKILAVGYINACALDDDGVWCWGEGLGQLIPAGLTNVLKISVGYQHACVLDEETPGQNVVKCWGSNAYGQLNVPEDL